MGRDDDHDEPKRAVALKWEGWGTPTVVAKGEGHVAETIVAKAREAGVAVEENPLLAKALSAVELDRPIPEPLFKAVAEVIAFVLRASGRMK
jgi:flagellar biosynthesis protein